ncbi:MAG: hypothetical protein KKF56_01685 [Nanoarchaeota archaeon]|nr:hypothetical protein [Nanoarchaeota archaeon]
MSKEPPREIKREEHSTCEHFCNHPGPLLRVELVTLEVEEQDHYYNYHKVNKISYECGVGVNNCSVLQAIRDAHHTHRHVPATRYRG